MQGLRFLKNYFLMAIINLVAHFLKEKGYTETLKTLETEYGQPINTEIHRLPNKETLNEIVSDRFNFKSLQDEFNVIDQNTKFNPWKFPYPHTIELEILLNEVLVSVDTIPTEELMVLSTAKQRLIVMRFNGEILKSFDQLIGRVVIKKVVCDNHDLYLAGMNGVIYRYKFNENLTELTKQKEVSAHKRIVVDMKIVKVNGINSLVSLGFDKQVKMVKLPSLEIAQSFELPLVPTCFDVVNYNDNILILVGYNEHTLLDVIKLESGFSRLYKISINDAEFSTTNFTPRTIQFHTINGELYAAIATSHEPYMRVMVISISQFDASDDIKRNQIVRNILTMSPQDKFSTPMINWRQNGHGIWVLGDDGILRGINLNNTNIIELKGHENKIKHLCIIGNDDSEKIVTFGDDKIIKLWH